MLENNISIILSQSPTFLAICMMMMNIGSKFISSNLTPFQSKLFNTSLMKFICLFCMIFYTTKNLFSALIITTCFSIFLNILINENSKYNLIFPLQSLFNFKIKIPININLN